MQIIKNFLQKNTPTIEFWTHITGLADIEECKPKPAKYFMPKWLKDIPSSIPIDGSYKTIKNCPVVPEFLMQGYIIPMWCDTILKVGNSSDDWSWKTSSHQFPWEIHGDIQFINHLPTHERNNFVFKALCPWLCKTPKGYSVYQLPLFYHFNKDFKILPGSIRTDMHFDINQQVMVKHNSEIFIPRGTPFAWYIPYKRQKYNMTAFEETLDKKKEREISNLNLSLKFNGAYKTMAKKFDENNKKKRINND